MHFSSATPTGGILVLSAPREGCPGHLGCLPARAPQTPARTSHPHWSPPGSLPGTVQEGALRVELARPRVRPHSPTQGGPQRTPRTLKPARLSFQRQATFTHARQNPCTPKALRFPLPVKIAGKVPPPLHSVKDCRPSLRAAAIQHLSPCP